MGHEELNISESLKDLNDKSRRGNGFKRVGEVKTSLFYQWEMLIYPLGVNYCSKEGWYGDLKTQYIHIFCFPKKLISFQERKVY